MATIGPTRRDSDQQSREPSPAIYGPHKCSYAEILDDWEYQRDELTALVGKLQVELTAAARDGKNERNELANIVKVLKAEANAAKEEENKREELMTTVRTLQAEVRASKVRQGKRDEIFKDRLNAGKAAAYERDELATTVKSLQEHLAASNKRLHDQDVIHLGELGAANAVQQQRDELASVVQDLQDEHDKLLITIDALRAKGAAAKVVEDERDELRSKVNRLQDEIDAANSVKSERNELAGTDARLRAEIHAAKELRSKTRRELEQSVELSNNLRRSNEKLAASKFQYEQTIRAKHRTLVHTRYRFTGIGGKLNKLLKQKPGFKLHGKQDIMDRVVSLRSNIHTFTASCFGPSLVAPQASDQFVLFWNLFDQFDNVIEYDKDHLLLKLRPWMITSLIWRILIAEILSRYLWTEDPCSEPVSGLTRVSNNALSGDPKTKSRQADNRLPGQKATTSGPQLEQKSPDEIAKFIKANSKGTAELIAHMCQALKPLCRYNMEATIEPSLWRIVADFLYIDELSCRQPVPVQIGMPQFRPKTRFDPGIMEVPVEVRREPKADSEVELFLAPCVDWGYGTQTVLLLKAQVLCGIPLPPEARKSPRPDPAQRTTESKLPTASRRSVTPEPTTMQMSDPNVPASARRSQGPKDRRMSAMDKTGTADAADNSARRVNFSIPLTAENLETLGPGDDRWKRAKTPSQVARSGMTQAPSNAGSN